MTARHYYSVPAFAICSLFGGPIAAVAFAAIEARALGRLRRELPWLVTGLVALVLAAALAARRGLLDRALSDLGTQHVPTWEHLAYRLTALGYFAGYWWLHRHERRALAAAGVAPLPGYAAGLVALMIGLVGGTVLLLALR
jgi:energy-converting hydrogenase Eha subunit A